MNPIVVTPSMLVIAVLAMLCVTLLLALLIVSGMRNTTPQIIVSPDPEYYRRQPGVGAFVALIVAVLMVFAVAAMLGS